MDNILEKKRKLNKWFKVKFNIDCAGKTLAFKERDIWWCDIGENVGVEINGKGEFFRRPVLVFKKINQYSFMGIPLTSQPHIGAWYVKIEFQDKINMVNLAQAKTLSVKRLQRRMGQLTSGDFAKVRQGFQKYYCGRL